MRRLSLFGVSMLLDALSYSQTFVMIVLFVGMMYLICADALVGERYEDSPILELKPKCPASIDGPPVIQLTVGVPGTAKAACRNGQKNFTSDDGVLYNLIGSFDQSYDGTDCVFYQKTSGHSYTVNVEYGWGETSAMLITKRKSFTVTCAFDANGIALTSTQKVDTSFLTPKEEEMMMGNVSDVDLQLQVVGLNDNPFRGKAIGVGEKIRLKAVEMSNKLVGFQVVSCVAENSVSSYAILHAGCGDGLVLPASKGFKTTGSVAYSPYFVGFKLVGGDMLTFRCTFSICHGLCDGDSCALELRRKRSSRLNASFGHDGRKSKIFVAKNIKTLRFDKPKEKEVVPGYPDKIPHVSMVTVLSVCVPVMFMCIFLTVYICWSHRARRRRGESTI